MFDTRGAVTVARQLRRHHRDHDVQEVQYRLNIDLSNREDIFDVKTASDTIRYCRYRSETGDCWWGSVVFPEDESSEPWRTKEPFPFDSLDEAQTAASKHLS